MPTSPNGETNEERFEAQKRAAGIAKTNNMWWVYVLELKKGEDGNPVVLVTSTWLQTSGYKRVDTSG